jgi:hypothetical protein
MPMRLVQHINIYIEDKTSTIIWDMCQVKGGRT